MLAGIQTETKPQTKQKTQEHAKPANFFSANIQSKNNLKEFASYKPEDISSKFKKQEVKTDIEIEYENSAHQEDVTSKNKQQEEIVSTEFENITHLDEVAKQSTFEIEVPNKYNDEKKLFRLNLKGKLLLGVGAVALALLMFLSIFNAVTIANAKKHNATLSNQIESQSELLNWVDKEYNNVSNEQNILQKVEEQGFVEPGQNDVVEFEKIKKTKVKVKKQKTNLFDKICDFFYSIFGGK